MFYEVGQPHGLRHDPFKALVVPRPIAWVSTVSPEGGHNLAPYSFFNAMSFDPPVLAIGINGAHVEGGPKDSLRNIEQMGEFVCNLATWDLREQMNRSSASAPRGTSEFELAGLTPAPSRLVKAPRVKESPVQLECHYLDTVPLPPDRRGEPNAIVLGRVVAIHIDDSLLHDGLVDITLARPIARLGYMDYTDVQSVFQLLRPE